MKFCEQHWADLRQGVVDRGMWHLVAKSGQDAAEAAVRDLEGRPEPGDWDPLMAAHWALAGRVMDAIGNSQGPMAAVSAMADPEWCPMCSIQESFEVWDKPEQIAKHGPRPAHARDAAGWIDSCLDAMLKHARGKGLVPPTQ